MRAVGGILRDVRRHIALAATVLPLVAVACTADEASPEAGDPPIVRVGVLPDQDPEVVRKRYQPLLDHIDRTARVRTELSIPDDYEDLLTRYGEGEYDLVWFGGLTFLQADADGDARPLVMRDVDLEFTSDFVVRTSSPGETIEDFAGGVLAFGPYLSTSGHLMPRYFIQQSGTTPEALFGDVLHSGGHDETVGLVLDGTADIGAVNSSVVGLMFGEGELLPDDVRVLTTTFPFRNYTWATPAALDEGLRVRLQDAFLVLDVFDPEDREILKELDAGGFVPASRSDFEELRLAATSIGLLDEAAR